MWLWSGKVPYLDGLRGVAIVCVLLSHFERDEQAIKWDLWELGHLGVTLFFVISGFLITLLLLRERRKTGANSCSAFYRRRALRIFPAYLAFLATIGVLQMAGAYHVAATSWIAALTYTSCFAKVIKTEWIFGHTWSLSVEEHFYLIWPFIFTRMKPRPAFVLLCSYFASVPFLRWTIAQGHIRWMDMDYASPIQMSSIAVGCMVALIIAGGVAPRCKAFMLSKPALCLGLGCGVFAGYHLLRPEVKVAIGDPIKALVVALVLAWILFGEKAGILHRFLVSTPMVWIGLISYSMYLWQQPLTENSQLPTDMKLVRLVLLGILASLSYKLIESPFLKLKESFNLGSARTATSTTDKNPHPDSAPITAYDLKHDSRNARNKAPILTLYESQTAPRPLIRKL